MADGQQTALVKAPIRAGGQIGAILANSFDDAWRIGGVMAASGLTPFKRQEEACAAIMAGGEVGMPPFASLQSFMYVNGRLAMWGDAQLALVRSHGHRVEEWYEGTLEAGDLKAFTKVTRADTGEIILEEFSIDDAKRAGLWQAQETVRRKGKNDQWYDAKNDSPWFRYPKRMLKYRARGFALRDGCSDILRGIKMAEEVQDYPPEEVRVIEPGDCDQHPDEERISPQGAFKKGKAAKDAVDAAIAQMDRALDIDELADIWIDAQRLNVSENRRDALAEHYERNQERLSKPPQDETAPTAFDKLKSAGLECLEHETPQQKREALDVWAGSLTPAKLEACTEEQRDELRALFKNIKAEIEAA